MAKVIQFDNYREIDTRNDPCSICKEKRTCDTTCPKAENWWNLLAKKIF